VSSVSSCAGDSIVLRRFAVSAGRARAELRQFLVLYGFLRASSAELRQTLVIGAFWRCPVPCVWLRAGFAELRQFLVLIITFCLVVSVRSLTPFILFELASVLCLLVESPTFMCVLLINSEWCVTSEV
jgi:hypothetical protein